MDQQNQGAILGDKELLNDALDTQKMISGAYNAFANECAAPEVRNDFLAILQDEHMIQADVFTEMQKRGWYPLQQADQAQVTQAKQKFENMRP